MEICQNPAAETWRDLRRLRFAWSRGAILQQRDIVYPDEPTAWMDRHFTAPFASVRYEQRIRPDDEHLEYGRLSTALRAYVLNHPRIPRGLYHEQQAAMNLFYKAWNFRPPFNGEVNEFRMALWLFSEMLADEGL